MQYVEVIKFCLSLPRTKRVAASDLGNAFKLCVDESVFGYFETGAPVQWHFSLRVAPDKSDDFLNPPSVRKAADKTDDNWLTIQRVENFDEDLLKELIQGSYERAQQAA